MVVGRSWLSARTSWAIEASLRGRGVAPSVTMSRAASPQEPATTCETHPQGKAIRLMPVCVCGRRFEPGESYCVRCGRHLSSAVVEPAPAAAAEPAAPASGQVAPPFTWAPPVAMAADGGAAVPVPAQPWAAQTWAPARPEPAPAKPPHARLTLALVLALILTTVAAAGFVITLNATAV